MPAIKTHVSKSYYKLTYWYQGKIRDGSRPNLSLDSQLL